MATVRRSNQEIRVGRGRVNPDKLASLNEADIERFARDDESETSDRGEPRYVPPRTDVRALRERLGVSQAEFARRYLLPARTVQQRSKTCESLPSSAGPTLCDRPRSRCPGARAALINWSRSNVATLLIDMLRETDRRLDFTGALRSATSYETLTGGRLRYLSE